MAGKKKAVVVAYGRRAKPHRYDITDADELARLKRFIRENGKKYRKKKRRTDKAYYKKKLKSVYVSAHGLKKSLLKTAVLKCVTKYIDKPSKKDLAKKPKHFAVVKKRKKKAKQVHRNPTDFDKNVTPSLQNFTEDDESLLGKSKRLEGWLKENSELVEEHARRRGEFFFLLCVAIYQSNRLIILANPTKQYGLGKQKMGTQACHSSLYPALADQSKKSMRLRKAGEEQSILSGTYFEDALNTTVELPVAVNRMDSLCEGGYDQTARGMRRKLCETLQAVANGDKTPVRAMQVFFKQMTAFFDGPAAKNAEIATKNRPVAIKKRIVELQRRGTLYWASKSGKKLSVKARKTLLRQFGADKDKTKDELYKERQAEILTSKP